MNILHKFGVTGKYKAIINGQLLDRKLFIKSGNIQTYLNNLSTTN